MSRRQTVLAAALAAALIAASALATDRPSAAYFLVRARAATQLPSVTSKIEMTLENKRGETLGMRILTRTKTEGGLSRTVSTFLEPDEAKGTKFLMTENAGRDDDMKIFIPDIGRVRVVSSTQRKQSYMGSDFAYGDLESVKPDVGTHKLLAGEAIDGQMCAVVETDFTGVSGALYPIQRHWVRADNDVLVRTDYIGKDGEVRKRKTVEKFEPLAGKWIATRIVMEDFKRKHRTVVEVVDSGAEPLDDSYFTDQFLKKTHRY